MKRLKRAAAILAVLVAGLFVTAVPAQAHDDPWNTHTHCNSYGCYKMCSWSDKTFFGCQNGYYFLYGWR